MYTKYTGDSTTICRTTFFIASMTIDVEVLGK